MTAKCPWCGRPASWEFQHVDGVYDKDGNTKRAPRTVPVCDEHRHRFEAQKRAFERGRDEARAAEARLRASDTPGAVAALERAAAAMREAGAMPEAAKYEERIRLLGGSKAA
jgi:hypothetical protein